MPSVVRSDRTMLDHNEAESCSPAGSTLVRCFLAVFFLAILAVLAVLVALVVLALWSRQSMAPAPQIPESLAGAPSVCTYLVHITEDRLTRTQTAFFPLPLSWPRPIGARCLVRSTGLGGRRGSSDPMHVAGVGRYRLP
jgi:hypothetical protein